MITAVKPWARRRRRPRAQLGALMLGPGQIALGALAAAGALNDCALSCFGDASGRAVRIGHPVRARSGREISAVAIAQCAADAGRRRLRVLPNLYVADVMEIDLRDVEGDVAGRGVRLALSADQLQAHTCWPRPEPLDPGMTRGPSLDRNRACRRGVCARGGTASGPPHLQTQPMP